LKLKNIWEDSNSKNLVKASCSCTFYKIIDEFFMGLIDFSEIRNGHEFERFAELFLQEDRGILITAKSAIGADGGRDLIGQETNAFGGVGINWLVSCKHFAGVKASVGEHDDEARVNKLHEFNCQGFIFFYSTPHTQFLSRAVENVCNGVRARFHFLGPDEITNRLVSNPRHYPLIQQFFPNSYARLMPPIQGGPSCCSGGQGKTRYAAFAVYKKRINDYTVGVDIICEACIDDHLNYLWNSGFNFAKQKIWDHLEFD
jgi:hypothetical protein